MVEAMTAATGKQPVRQTPADPDPFGGVDFSQLERSLRRPRTLIDFLLTATVSATFVKGDRPDEAIQADLKEILQRLERLERGLLEDTA